MTLTAGAKSILALTMGEPSGIGGEIAIKAWLRRDDKLPPFMLIDNPGRIKQLASRLGLKVPLGIIKEPEEAADVFASSLPLLAQPLSWEVICGKPNPHNTKAVISAIETAVNLALSGRVLAVVTNPIHKQCMYDGGFAFPGHTEFLAHLAGSGASGVMMLACPKLRVVPISVHVSLKEAIKSLTSENIINKTAIVDAALRDDFNITKPRLAIAGLNPHSGEGGAMGKEEQTIIIPAINELKNMGISVFGPLSADTMFDVRARKNYDAAICMYHDQALIPIKTIAFDSAVNVTLGLPFVRTSPDHGTALDIAGSGKADENSLIGALKLAAYMAVQRHNR